MRSHSLWTVFWVDHSLLNENIFFSCFSYQKPSETRELFLISILCGRNKNAAFIEMNWTNRITKVFSIIIIIIVYAENVVWLMFPENHGRALCTIIFLYLILPLVAADCELWAISIYFHKVVEATYSACIRFAFSFCVFVHKQNRRQGNSPTTDSKSFHFVYSNDVSIVFRRQTIKILLKSLHIT